MGIDESLLRMAGEELGIDPILLLEGIVREEWRRQMHDAIPALLGDRAWDERAWMTNAAGWQL